MYEQWGWIRDKEESIQHNIGHEYDTNAVGAPVHKNKPREHAHIGRWYTELSVCVRRRTTFSWVYDIIN